MRTLVLLIIILLTACVQMPELQRPVLPVQNAWPVDSAPVGKLDAAKTHWRTFFVDPRLQALIAAALENNRDVRIAVARVAEARAQYGIARADKLPTLNFGSDSNISVLSASYEVDFWGRVSGLTEAARVSYLATQEAKRTVHLSLVADVASTYFTLLQLDESLVQTEKTVELREQSLALITKGRDLGATYDYEVQLASGILESTRGNLAALAHQRAVAAHKLEFLVGQSSLQLPAGKGLDGQGLDSEFAAGLPSDVLLLRPDVIAAEHRLKAAHANISVARAAYFPRISLTTGYGVASQGLSALFGKGAWYFSPILSAIPIFDNGRTASGVDAAQSRRDVAIAEYEKTIQLAFREVADLLSARISLANQVRAAMLNKQAQEIRLQIAQARHVAGFVSYLDVLDSQRELLSAQQVATQLRRAQLESVAQLYKALGGGDFRLE